MSDLKENGLSKFIKDSAQTIFALGALYSAGWMITNQNASNVQLAVIGVKLESLDKSVSNLKDSVNSGEAQLRADLELLKTRVNILEKR